MKLHYLPVFTEGAGEALSVIGTVGRGAVRRDPDVDGPGQDVYAAIALLPVNDLVSVSPLVLADDFRTAYSFRHFDRLS